MKSTRHSDLPGVVICRGNGWTIRAGADEGEDLVGVRLQVELSTGGYVSCDTSRGDPLEPPGPFAPPPWDQEVRSLAQLMQKALTEALADVEGSGFVGRVMRQSREAVIYLREGKTDGTKNS